FLCLFYLFFLLFPLPPGSTLFPYTTLFRSEVERQTLLVAVDPHEMAGEPVDRRVVSAGEVTDFWTFDLDDSGAEVGQLPGGEWRSEEHTSELQSRFDLVCRLLLEKKKKHGD